VRGRVGHELISRIEADRDGAGDLVDVKGRKDLVSRLLGGAGALVAIAKGLVERLAVGREADVVHAPAIDGDGGNAFRGNCGSLAQALFKA